MSGSPPTPPTDTNPPSGASPPSEAGPPSAADEADEVTGEVVHLADVRKALEGKGDGEAVEDAPDAVAEMADACVRFVESAVGLKLDYSAETLPVLDHYMATRREELLAKPELIGLVAKAAGAYFGEVARRRFRSFWQVEHEDPSTWELRLEPVFLAFVPFGVAYDAITHGDSEGPTALFQLDDEDREAIEARLAELPPGSDEEFFSFSTRLEVLEIAVDAIKARMMSSGLGEVIFTEEDYGER